MSAPQKRLDREAAVFADAKRDLAILARADEREAPDSIAAALGLPLRIVLEVMRDAADEGDARVSLPRRVRGRRGAKQTFHLGEWDADVRAEAKRLDRPLSWLIVQAWRIARKEVHALPVTESPAAKTARERAERIAVREDKRAARRAERVRRADARAAERLEARAQRLQPASGRTRPGPGPRLQVASPAEPRPPTVWRSGRRPLHSDDPAAKLIDFVGGVRIAEIWGCAPAGVSRIRGGCAPLTYERREKLVEAARTRLAEMDALLDEVRGLIAAETEART